MGGEGAGAGVGVGGKVGGGGGFDENGAERKKVEGRGQMIDCH